MKVFEDKFYYTAREKRGIYVFLSMSILVVLFIFYQNKFVKPSTLSKSRVLAKITEIESEKNKKEEKKEFVRPKKANNKKSPHYYSDKHSSSKPKTLSKKAYREFNPNTVSKEELLEMGVSSFAATNLVKYRNTGARIHSVTKLKSIYGFEKIYDEISNYVIIPSRNEKKNLTSFKREPKESKNINDSIHSVKSKSYTKKKEKLWININIADKEDLMEIPGIGPKYAGRIIKYRELLGGYVNKEQLLNVYNLPDSVYQNISDQVYAKGPVDRININNSSVEDLTKNVFINWKQAKLIVNFRRQHGPFSTIEELSNIRAFNKEYLEKIKPYLRIN